MYVTHVIPLKMDKSINNLLKTFFTFRNSTAFHRYLTINSSQTSLCHSLKEIESKSIPEELSDNPAEIFDYVQKNKDSLTGQNCIQVLKKLSICYSELNRSTIITRETNLLQLCNELDKRIKTLNSTETIEAIQLLFELRVPPRSMIFQSLLRNICNSNDSFTEKNAKIVLPKVLSSMKSSNLKTSLENVLSMSTKYSKGDKRYRDIVAICAKLFKAVGRKTNRKEQLAPILNEISKYPHEIPVLTAKSILVSFTKDHCIGIVVSSFRDLLTRIQDVLINEAWQLEYNDVLEILSALKAVRRNKSSIQELYNERLIDSMITSLLTNDALSIEKAIEILVLLRSLGHFQRSLIDYVSQRCFYDPMFISKLKRDQLLKFVSGLAVSDYKPLFWESMQQLIADHEDLKVGREYILIRLLCSLAVYDSFPHNLISIAFRLNEKQCIEAKPSTRRRLYLLYQLVKTSNCNYPGPWPSESVLKMSLLTTSNREICYPLLSALERALGGSQYIKSNLRTRIGHVIDHVIVMRKGGFPVAINLAAKYENENENISFVEDIVVPSESHIFTIISLGSDAYLRNIKQPRGDVSASIRSLEALKYIVVPVYMPEWMDLDDRDKIPFLMNHIKLKYPADNISVNI